MAEMMAFNRRHAPRHGDATIESRRQSLTLETDDPTAHNIGDHTHANASVVITTSAPKSNSKKRRDRASVSLHAAEASSATAGAPTGSARKMSGAQLRLFFLLCVALYFSVIFFADDIVSFAEWMSEEDPVGRGWQTPSKAPVAGGSTPKPAQPPGGESRKKTAEPMVVKGIAQTEEGKTEERKGNLRGGEDANVAEGKKKQASETQETKAPDTMENETPSPQPVVTQEERTGVETEETTPEKETEMETEKPTEEPREELPPVTPVVTPTLVVDDAPLESVEEDGKKMRGETTTEPEPETPRATETAAAPAEIPELDVTSNPNTHPPKEEREGAQPDDIDADAATQVPETPQQIQAT